MNTIIAGRIWHDGGLRVTLRFPFDRKIVELVRTLPGTFWNKELKCWLVPDLPGIEFILTEKLKGHVLLDLTNLRAKGTSDSVKAPPGKEKAEDLSNFRAKSASDSGKQPPGKARVADLTNLQTKTPPAPGLAEQHGTQKVIKRVIRQPQELIDESFDALISSPGGSVLQGHGNVQRSTSEDQPRPEPESREMFDDSRNPSISSPHHNIPQGDDHAQLTKAKKQPGQKPISGQISSSLIPPSADTFTPRSTDTFTPAFASTFTPSPEAVNASRRIRSVVLSPAARAGLQKYKSWLESHRFPETTIRTYTGMMETFLKFVAPKEADECDSDDLVRMVNDYILPEGLSYSYQNQLISAVKKFYKVICRNTIDPGTFTRPRTQHRLPNVLSKDEVRRILEASVNEKHRLILSIIYGCGLRRSEVLMIRPADIDRDRMLLTIRQAKGFKDRIAPLSPRLLEKIDTYLQRYRPAVFLFEGQRQGSAYSSASVEKIFRTACQKAGIKKEITLHGLRHSYATHLLESGTDLRYIQELLGHKSSRTTEIYTHVTEKSIQKIRSPFDDL